LGNLSHQRTLTLVTIAATPEDDDQLSPGEGARGFQTALESVGRMSVVTQHRRVGRDYLQPARYLGHAVQTTRHFVHAVSERQSAGCRGESVLDVHIPDQRQGDIGTSGRGDQPPLAALGGEPDRLRPNVRAGAYPERESAAFPFERSPLRRIGVDHCRAVWLQVLEEQRLCL